MASKYVIDEKDRNEMPLFGRDRLSQLQLNCMEIKHISSPDNIMESLIKKFPQLFQASLGEMKTVKAKRYVRPNAVSSRTFRNRSKVDGKLQSLLNEGVISPVEHSD